jgi:DNA end-binding protein Ku
MEILEFVKSDDVDAVYFESSYYMAPDDAGEKPYALLFEALRRSNFLAIAKIAMHNREHIVILRPGKRGILLHTMYYEDEVRKVEEFRTDTNLVKDKELALAMSLISSLEAQFEPEKYKDAYRENLLAMIDAKVQGKQIVETPTAQQLAPVVDIMEALKASLALGKKPPQSVARAAQAASEVPEAANAPKPKRGKKSANA